MTPEAASLLQLTTDLRHEMEAIDRIVAEAGRCVTDLAERAPTSLELRGGV